MPSTILKRGRRLPYSSEQQKDPHHTALTGESVWRKGGRAIRSIFPEIKGAGAAVQAVRDLADKLKQHAGREIELAHLRSIARDAISPRKRPRPLLQVSIENDADAERLMLYLARNVTFLESKPRRKR